MRATPYAIHPVARPLSSNGLNAIPGSGFDDETPGAPTLRLSITFESKSAFVRVFLGTEPIDHRFGSTYGRGRVLGVIYVHVGRDVLFALVLFGVLVAGFKDTGLESGEDLGILLDKIFLVFVIVWLKPLTPRIIRILQKILFQILQFQGITLITLIRQKN